MIIKLPWIEQIDSLQIPDNFDGLVKKSFEKFTEGTREEYRFEDKLLYLDNLRKHYISKKTTREAVEQLISEAVMYQLDEYGEMPDKDEILSVEFMERCYDEGFRPYRQQYETYSSSANEKTLKVILKIIQIIVDY